VTGRGRDGARTAADFSKEKRYREMVAWKKKPAVVGVRKMSSDTRIWSGFLRYIIRFPGWNRPLRHGSFDGLFDARIALYYLL
jgi:hypothetical protein